MKTLGLVVPALAETGGVQTLARFLLATARRSGTFRVRLVSLCMSGDDPCSVNLRDPASWLRGIEPAEGTWEGFPYLHVGAHLGELEFQRYRQRGALVSALADCDVIQVAGGYPAWANAVTGLGKPVALQVASLARVERQARAAAQRGWSGRWRQGMTRMTARLDDRALRAVDAIQVLNAWLYDHARRINDTRPVDLRLAPPGVDTDHFTPGGCRELEREPYVLWVGRFADPRKNVDLMLQAFARLPASLRACTRLLLVGSDRVAPDRVAPDRVAPDRVAPDRVAPDRVAPDQVSPDRVLPYFRNPSPGMRVRMVEHPSAAELLRLYQRAAVLALSSDEEGFGLVLLEAMACGVPVVATRCGGPEGIVTDGADGFLVPRGDAAALAGRLERLLTEPERNRRMGRQARATVSRRFDLRGTGDVFIDMWERLVAQAGDRLPAVGTQR